MRIVVHLLMCLVCFVCVAAGQSGATENVDPCAEIKTRADRAETKLKDWPNIARYHDANTKVTPPTKTEDRVVFMGDSITDGWKLIQYFPGKPYINRGISGQTTPQMLIRFRPDVIDLKPKVVVILAGTNDLAGNTGPMTIDAIEANLQSMADLARSNGIRVVMASIMPISDYGKNKDGQPIVQSQRRPPASIIAINAWMKKYTNDNGLTYLDYFSAMVDDKGFMKSDISRDGLHPNDKGYEMMKPLAEQAINAALKRKATK